MTQDDPRPDYSDLLRSPYDAEPDASIDKPGSDSDADISWKPAVIAAALGALLVSAFVIYAIASTPDEVAEDATSETVTSTSIAAEATQSTALPEGFTAVTDEVGAKVEAIDVSTRATVLAVSSAVSGSEDPAETAPLDAAYWELVTQDGPSPMTAQYQSRGAVGSVTVEFAPLAALRGPSLVPSFAVAEDEVTVTIDLDADLPASVNGYEIDLGDGRSVDIDALVVGDGWGHVTWSSRGGPAKVETVVRFIGTDDPATDVVDETVLTPAHLRALSQGSGVVPLPPLYGFSGSEQLIRSGEPLAAGNEAEAIVVEIRVVMPSEVVEGQAIVVPTRG
ncbi:MAG: hypothetical protein ACR2NG_04010 [Acidimicrobiia bacterium]